MWLYSYCLISHAVCACISRLCAQIVGGGMSEGSRCEPTSLDASVVQWATLDVNILDNLQLLVFGPYLHRAAFGWIRRCNGPAKYGILAGPHNCQCLRAVLALYYSPPLGQDRGWPELRLLHIWSDLQKRCLWPVLWQLLCFSVL